MQNFVRSLGLPGYRQQCFWRQLCAVWAISGSCRQPRSISRHLVDIKSEGMRDIYGISIDHYSCLVISDEVFNVEKLSSLRKTIVRIRGNYHQPLEHQSTPSSFCRLPTILHVHFAVYLRNTILHFVFCIIPTLTIRSTATLGGK